MPPIKKSANVSRLKSLSRSRESDLQRTSRAIESAGGRTASSRNKGENEYPKAEVDMYRDPLDRVLGTPDLNNLIKNVGSSMKRTAQPMSARQAIQILREHMKDLAKDGKERSALQIRKLIDKLTGEASINRKVRRGGKVNVEKDPTRRRAVRDRQLDDDTVDRFLRPYPDIPF